MYYFVSSTPTIVWNHSIFFLLFLFASFLVSLFNLATCKFRLFCLFQNLPKHVWWKADVYRPSKRQDFEGKWSPHSVIAVNPSVGRQPWDFHYSVLAKKGRTLLISNKKVSENTTVRTFFVYPYSTVFSIAPKPLVSCMDSILVFMKKLKLYISHQ